jgi:hypothetical protein
MAYDYKAAMEAINRKKFSALPDLGVERTPKAEKRTLVGSSLPAPSKPIAQKGKRGKRLEKGDKVTRKEVKERDQYCVACDLFGQPEKTLMDGPDHWAHVHGRDTHKGGDVRNHPAYSVRLCPTHHLWHHKRGSHTLGIRVVPYYKRFKQIFTVDGNSLGALFRIVDGQQEQED